MGPRPSMAFFRAGRFPGAPTNRSSPRMNVPRGKAPLVTTSFVQGARGARGPIAATVSDPLKFAVSGRRPATRVEDNADRLENHPKVHVAAPPEIPIFPRR